MSGTGLSLERIGDPAELGKVPDGEGDQREIDPSLAGGYHGERVIVDCDEARLGDGFGTAPGMVTS